MFEFLKEIGGRKSKPAVVRRNKQIVVTRL
jgi:hypothetical protein